MATVAFGPMDMPKPQRKKKSSGSAIGGAIAGLGKTWGIDPQRDAGSLSEAIERQSAIQKRQAMQNSLANAPIPANPYDLLQSQLFDSINSISIPVTPLEQLRRMAESQVNAQFNPMIEALRNQMEMKEQRGERSQGQARQMYNALSSDLMGQIPGMKKEFNAEDSETNRRYDDAQRELASQYGNESADQAAVMRQLGIQAAQQESQQQAADDQKYFQSQMELDQQQAMNALNEQQAATQSYQRDIGSNARMAGENRAQEIGQMLEDYLTEAGGQLSGLESQRSSALEALVQQMQAQDQARAEKVRQQEIDNMMQMFNFQLQAQNASDRNARSGSGADQLFKGTSGLEGASNYLAQMYPDQPIRAENIMEQLNDVLANKDVVRGKYTLEPADEATGRGAKYSDVGQEYMMDLLRREFEKEGDRYGAQDVNAAINALLAYMGKLR